MFWNNLTLCVCVFGYPKFADSFGYLVSFKENAKLPTYGRRHYSLLPMLLETVCFNTKWTDWTKIPHFYWIHYWLPFQLTHSLTIKLLSGLKKADEVLNSISWLISIKSSNALCCYPNINSAIRNLGLNTPTAPIFLQFNYFRENIWVIIWVQFHFLYIFVGRVDRIHKTSHTRMLSFYFFASDLQCFGDELNVSSKTAPANI